MLPLELKLLHTLLTNLVGVAVTNEGYQSGKQGDRCTEDGQCMLIQK